MAMASAPTEDQVAAIPAVSLRDHLEGNVQNLDQRLTAQVENLDLRIAEKLAALALAHDSFKQEMAAWRQVQNEFRGQINDERTKYADRGTVASEVRRVEEALTHVESGLESWRTLAAERSSAIERSLVGIQGTIAQQAAIATDVKELRDWRSSVQNTLAQVSTIAKDVDSIKGWRSETQGKGAIIAVVVSAVVAIAASVIVGLILTVARGG
jgi:chromosome segregation ATPase